MFKKAKARIARRWLEQAHIWAAGRIANGDLDLDDVVYRTRDAARTLITIWFETTTDDEPSCDHRLDASHVCTRDAGHEGNHCDIEDPRVEWATYKRMVGRRVVLESRRVPAEESARRQRAIDIANRHPGVEIGPV